jgi:hypothetical protein|tara:strand:- start:2626 stop:2925 length:300 start_codon:yes stop_codon:yes gene_type:complete
MGLIINKSALFCSGFAVLALIFGLNPYAAFAVSMASFVPVRMAFGGKMFSQTGAFAGFGAVVGMAYFGFSPLQAFVLGAGSGYTFLYFWIFAVPKLLKD